MKNLFNDLLNSEKNRILEMHKGATKRNYLSEQKSNFNKHTTSDLHPISDAHPINHPFYKEMITNIEGDNVKLVSFTTNKLVIDAFGNIYTITKQPNTR